MAENFNPLEIVIEMMKSEKAGDKQREIDRRCKEMNESMDVLVSGTYWIALNRIWIRVHVLIADDVEFYEGFNRAIRTYTNILSNVNESKHTVDTLNDSFSKVGNAFNIRSAGLNGMFNQITEYDCTLQILDIMYVYINIYRFMHESLPDKDISEHFNDLDCSRFTLLSILILNLL